MCVVPLVNFEYPEMADLKEQHIRINICFDLRKNDTQTSEVFKVAFEEQTKGKTQVLQ